MRLNSFACSFPHFIFYVFAVLVSANTYSKTLIFQSDSTLSQSQKSAEQASAANRSRADVSAQEAAQETAPASRHYSTSPGGANTRTSNAGTHAGAIAANSELVFVIEELKQDVRNLRGLLEEQAFRLQQLEKNSKSRYRDIDARVLKLSKGLARNASALISPLSSGADSVDAGSGSSKTAPKVRAVQPASDEQKLAYRNAYQLVQDKQFEGAVDALHAYIEKYPEGELTGNAYYWLGEVYLVLPQLKQAQQSFDIVVKTFPGHRKVADAMFKLAVTYDRLQDPVNTEKYLKKVQQQFPSSTASKLAKSYKISR